MRATVISYLEDFMVRGDEVAFAHRRGLRLSHWSYKRVAETGFQFARELEARGVVKGHRVLLCGENSPQWVAAFFGCLLRGAIVVPLDVGSDAGFVARVQQQVEATLAVLDAGTRGSVKSDLPVVRLEDLASQVGHHSSQTYQEEDIRPTDTVEIVFTSGTTAEPKGVRITHRNLLANLTPLEKEIQPFLKWEKLVHPIRFLNLLPLSHVFGQLMGLFVPQILGGEVFFQHSLRPTEIIETVRREHISVVVAVPRILDLLREKIMRDYESREKLDEFRSATESAAGWHFVRRWWQFREVHRMLGWRFWAFISGGATLNSDTEQFWQRLGFAVIQGYGMTETAALVSVNHPFKLEQGSIGRVLPGQEVKLAENGEILVRGENISPGYWQPDESGGTRRNGWFRTGDVGGIDEHGNLYFKGRKKDVIVTSAGLNIYPEDLESVLDRQPEIRASAVVGIEGPHGPEPLAVLILRQPQASPGAAVERANEELAQHQRICRWFLWPDEDFPRTATQKVRKQLITEMVRAGGGARVESQSRAVFPSSLEQLVHSVTGETYVDIDPAARLGTDLRLDSLGRVQLLSAIEDRYQVEIDEAAFTETTTLGEVERIIREGKGEEVAPYPYPRWQQRSLLNGLRIALLYLIVLPITRIMSRARILGREHLSNLREPLVFISNHVTMTDHALLLLALPGRYRRRLAVAMDGELLREWLHPPSGTGLFTRLRFLGQYALVVLFFNVFSMPHKSGFRQSFSFAGELMDRGFSLLVFPEGRRTEHGRLNPFMPGTGVLIANLAAPVVPVRIDGLYELKQRGRHFARVNEISVSIGLPIRYATSAAAEEIVKDLEDRVMRL